MSELTSTAWLDSLRGAHYMEDYDGKEVSQYYRFLVSPLPNIIVKKLDYDDDKHEYTYSVSQGDKYLECETKEGLLNILEMWGWDKNSGMRSEKVCVEDDTIISYGWLLSLAGAKESQVYPNRIVFDNNQDIYVSNYIDNEWFVVRTIESSKMVHTRMELKRVLESFGWDSVKGFVDTNEDELDDTTVADEDECKLDENYSFEWVKTLPYFQHGFYNGNKTLYAKTRLPNTVLECTICGFVLNYTCSGTHHIQPIPALKTKGDVLKLVDIFVDTN